MHLQGIVRPADPRALLGGEEEGAPATASLVAANTHTFLEANHTTAPFYCLLLLLSHFHLAVLGGEGGSIPASASLVGANTQKFP